MSPPIYTPDGQEVTEIVLPDGSTASEVVAPDGSVVFEAPLQFDYDVSESSDTSSIPDITGQEPDLSGGSFTTAQKNGVGVASFDGSTDQELSATFNADIATTYHMFWVAKSDSTTGSKYLWSSSTPDGWHVEGSDWSWYGTNSFTFGTSDTDWHVFDMLVENNSFDFAVDGSVVINNVASSNSDLSDMTLGDFSAGLNDWVGDFARMLCYNQDKSSQRSQIVSSLNDIYAVF